MNILQKLTVRHLRMNRKRTAITVLGIALSVAMVTAVSGMVVSFQDLLYRDSVEQEGLWHVRYTGLSAELMEQVAREPVFSDWETLQTEDGPVLSLQFEKLSKGIFGQSEAVCQKYGIAQEQVRYHNNLLIARGIVPGPYYKALYTFAGILLALIAIGSVLVISNSFAISADQRGVQFGLLKSTGATRAQIRRLVLLEGLALLLLSIPIGILAGFFAQWVALSIANSVLRSTSTVTLSAWFRVIASPAALGIAVVMALITVLAAAWFPAQRAARTGAVEAIRQTQSIRLSRRQVRVPPITHRLFGFEGMLAAKTMGRNRGKYRATIVSLVVSIVLFIGVSSFGSILIKATTLFYQDIGSNVMVSMHGDTAPRQDRLAAEMADWEGAQVHPARSVSGAARLPDGALTAEYERYFPDQVPTLRLWGIGEEDYAALCRSLHLDEAAAGEPGAPRGILVNTVGIHVRQGRRSTFTPYHLSAGDAFPVVVEEQELLVHIAAVTEQIPPGIAAQFTGHSLHIIVPDAVVLDLWPGDQEDFLWVAAMAQDAAGFTEKAQTLLEQELPHHTWSVLDYESAAANNRNITALVMLFVYGFIAMLTLIGVTSVIATISTSVALRAREFAMLRSVGMTEGAIDKMLRYESLLYGIKALAWGIPLGLLTCWLLYRAMVRVIDFPFIWPVGSIVISIAAIFFITFSTMAFAKRKQRQMNIAQVLRDDII